MLNDNALVARVAAGNLRVTPMQQRRFFIPGGFADCAGPPAGCPARKKTPGEGPLYPSISIRNGVLAATPCLSASGKHLSETVCKKSTSRQLAAAALPMNKSDAAASTMTTCTAARVHTGAATARRSDAAVAGHAIRTAAVDTCEKRHKRQHSTGVTREKCPATALPHAGAPRRLQSWLPLDGRMKEGAETAPSESWRSTCIFSVEKNSTNKSATRFAHGDSHAPVCRQAPVAAAAPKPARKRTAETASLVSEDERSVEEEEWNESDYDFIDDETEKEHGETGERIWQTEMRSVTGYDPRNYRDLDTEECEESNFDRVHAEEIFSAKVGQREDEEELHLQQRKMERKSRHKKRKKNKSC